MGPSTPILDNFDRANESPLGGVNWGLVVNDNAPINLVSTHVEPSAGSLSSCAAYWTTAVPSSFEVYVTMSLISSGNTTIVFARMTTPDLSGNYYRLEHISSSNDLRLTKVVAGSPSTLVSTTAFVLASGDKILFRGTDRLLEAEVFTGGLWQAALSIADLSYIRPGFIGLEGLTSQADPSFLQMDGFGGGGQPGLIGQFPTRHAGRGAGW